VSQPWHFLHIQKATARVLSSSSLTLDCHCCVCAIAAGINVRAVPVWDVLSATGTLRSSWRLPSSPPRQSIDSNLADGAGTSPSGDSTDRGLPKCHRRFQRQNCCVLRIVCFVSFYVLFVCKCVLYCTVLYCTVLYCTVLYCTALYYCHRVTTQLQLTNISYHIKTEKSLQAISVCSFNGSPLDVTLICYPPEVVPEFPQSCFQYQRMFTCRTLSSATLTPGNQFDHSFSGFNPQT
jgi:hypothetical protein